LLVVQALATVAHVVRVTRLPPEDVAVPEPPRAEPSKPARLDAAAVLALQQGAGNAAVARLLAPLPHGLRGGIADASGHDLGDVGVRYDSPAPAAFNALAFAGDNEIHLAAGREDLLPHEAWHVVQQRQGRVQPTGRLGSASVNEDPALEREAEEQGRRAAAAGSARRGRQASAPAGDVLQLVALTLATLQQIIGAVPVPTGGGTQVSFPDVALGGELTGLMCHFSATLAGANVTRVHVSFYPADDAEHKRKVVHYDYEWKAADETFKLYGQQLATWKPYKEVIGAIKNHAETRIAELRTRIVAALHPPVPVMSAPIAIPVHGRPNEDEDEDARMAITPPNTPPGGWPDTPPSRGGAFQFFRDPVKDVEVDPRLLKPHEIYFYVQLLNIGKLKVDEPDLSILKTRYLASQFPAGGRVIPFTTVPTLGFVEIALTLGDMGVHSWMIHWTLSESLSLAGGYIVQTVKALESVRSRKAHEPPKNEFVQFQEAWPVRPGASHTEGYTSAVTEHIGDMLDVGESRYEDDPHDDDFAHDEGFPNSAGGYVIFESTARFYQGMRDLPDDFAFNHPDTWAGEVIRSRPGANEADLTGSPGNTVVRRYRVDWDRDRDGGKTKLTLKA
jgi:hypothetical protein